MKTKIVLLLSGVLYLMVFNSCSTSMKKSQGPDALVSHIDSTVKPGDDFFLFANGKWFKENPIPASEQSNGLWTMIQDTINAQVRHICESSAAVESEKGSNKQKIGDFFFTGMDSVALNKKGLTELDPEMKAIDLIKNTSELMKEVAFLHRVAGAPCFSFFVGQDDKISNKYAVMLWQGGLNLPDRNYYFDNDARTVEIRKKYQEHLVKMFGLLGYPEAKAKQSAERMLKLETALAKDSRKREDLRDPESNYHKMTFGQFKATMPTTDMEAFFGTIGLKAIDTVIVGQPEFLSALDKLLRTTSIDDWKDYLKYSLVRSFSRYLDDRTYAETFDFYSRTMRGVQEPKPRWKRVVEQTNGSLGELIGQVYVDEYLPKGTKEKLLEIGNSIRGVFAERIKNLDWMSEPTKVKALEKLNAVIMKVGYPDHWKDMSSVMIDRSAYVRNVMMCNAWETDYMVAKYGKPVDRTEWNMTPQTYNAYYNPSNNEIVVPGSNIIVPGYERVLADDAILYSIIGGSTFAHEITHGFDDQGCKYDHYGNLNNWWTPEDSTKFYARTKLIVEQFNNYIAVDSLHINGELTQGENIADLGGIIMGYEAFKKTSQYKNQEKIAGVSPDQRFFLGYALAWMINERPEAIANQVKSNEHPPAKFRVLGPLSNMPEFYAAFNLKEGDAMWRPEEKRVKIW